MMTQTVTIAREPDERIHLKEGAILLQDQILGYIAWRGAHSDSYVDQSRDMDMTDGWVGDIANARIKIMKLETRKKVSAALRRKYGAEGIPVLHSKPVTVAAPKPVEALNRGFGPRGGDPTRPLAELKDAVPPVPSVEDAATEIEAEIAALLEDKSPEELAGLLIQAQDRYGSLQALHATMTANFHQASARIVGLSNQITSMDHNHERLMAELQERDATIQGQAEDMVEYEKTMDILQQRVDDLQGFKDGVVTQLRRFAVLLWQVVPPELPFEVQADYKLQGTETGRLSSTEAPRSTRPRIDEATEGPFHQFAER
jgi:hypothetical protein